MPQVQCEASNHREREGDGAAIAPMVVQGGDERTASTEERQQQRRAQRIVRVTVPREQHHPFDYDQPKNCQRKCISIDEVRQCGQRSSTRGRRRNGQSPASATSRRPGDRPDAGSAGAGRNASARGSNIATVPSTPASAMPCAKQMAMGSKPFTP